MPSPNKERISNIKNEVDELHPILEKLLRKLPGVTVVEYTHGREEMGADFVVRKLDHTLRTFNHVGVIAKCGRIGQDFSDVDRQIDECSLSRFLLGGKESVRLDEIWVIVTQNITPGAQKKIYDKYANRKIEFVDGSRLVALIDEHMPYYWTDVSIPAGEYLADLRARNEAADRAVSLVQVVDISFYVEQDLFEFPRLESRTELRRRQKPPRKVKIDEILSRNTFTLIEGGMGSGKSKFLRKLVSDLTIPETFISSKLLPVATTYAELVDNYEGNINALIEAKVPLEIIESDPELTFLVTIDAFDEKNIPIDKQVQALAELVDTSSKLSRTKIILTSRYLRGLDESVELEGTIARYHLPPLTLTKTIDFIKAVCKTLNLSTRLIEDLRKSQLFKELPHSPIAAILLAKLLNENPKELPSNMTELYSQYAELVLGRWDIDKGLQTLKEYEALEQILMRLAKNILDYEMQFVTLDDAKGLLKDYLELRNLDIDPSDLFEKMTSRCEILAIDDERKQLTFKHRTFAEFFYAKEALKLSRFELQDRSLEFYWMNTVFFFIGLQKDCPELLRKITTLAPESEGERWVKIINLGNYFLAGYASPYDVIVTGITETFLDAARLFLEISLQRISSPFARLSHMHLLQFIQMLVREGYSYQFFLAALEEAALRIDESSEQDDIKILALYFLNATYIELGVKDSFDFLLSRYSRNLPLNLLLAIHHEDKDNVTRTDLMKKQDRRLKKLIKGNPELKASIEAMYKRPIADQKQLSSKSAEGDIEVIIVEED